MLLLKKTVDFFNSAGIINTGINGENGISYQDLTMQKIISSRTGVIIKQPTGYSAFIPHKLSENSFKLKKDSEYETLLSEASIALGELKGITKIVPDPDLFVAFYIRKEALLSAQIEGTECSLDEIIQVEEESKQFKPVHEVVNYIDAMNYGLERLKEFPMSLRLINEIHERLLSDVRGEERAPGEYKKYQNWIGFPGCQLHEAAFIPPPPLMIAELMGDFEKYYYMSDESPVLVKAAILHAHFETIHPYADGNGRLGRLLITFILCQRKVLESPILYLSLFFKENRQTYYDMLMNIRFKGEWEAWVKFFLRGVRNTSQEAVQTASDILALFKLDREKISNYLAKYQVAFPCYDLLCHHPILTITRAVKELDSNYPSIKNIFDAFIKLGIMDPYDKKERNRSFQY